MEDTAFISFDTFNVNREDYQEYYELEEPDNPQDTIELIPGRVTLIGRRSGGGSCTVLPATTASGSCFQMSGNKQISTFTNGSFYNIDQGIEPDIPLTKDESFYDRAGLVEMIHDLR